MWGRGCEGLFEKSPPHPPKTFQKGKGKLTSFSMISKRQTEDVTILGLFSVFVLCFFNQLLFSLAKKATFIVNFQLSIVNFSQFSILHFPFSIPLIFPQRFSRRR